MASVEDSSSTIDIIDFVDHQDRPEFQQDRIHVYGILQSTCAKGTARHVVNRHEEDVNAFMAWADLCDWYKGSANVDNQSRAQHNCFMLPNVLQCAQ